MEFRNLQQIFHLALQVQQSDGATLVCRSCVSAYQLAQPGTIYIRDVRHIQNDVLGSLSQQ